QTTPAPMATAQAITANGAQVPTAAATAAGTTNMADATTLLTMPAASAIGPTARTRPASRAGTVLSAICGTDPPPTPRTAPPPRQAGRRRAPDTIRATGHPGAR